MPTRYFLHPDGSLRAVQEDESRCTWYWTLYSRLVNLSGMVAQTLDEEAPLADAIERATWAIAAHVEVCPQCQAWFARNEQIARQFARPRRAAKPPKGGAEFLKRTSIRNVELETA